jgi:hypothetical protein
MDAAKARGVALEVESPDYLQIARDVNKVLADLEARDIPMPKNIAIFAFRHDYEVLCGIAWRGIVHLNGEHRCFKDRKGRAKRNAKLGWLSSSSPLHVIRHEIGHAVHGTTAGECREWKWGDTTSQEHGEAIKAEVSRRAVYSASELVAEMFAGRLAGKRYSEHMMTLYKQARGPDVPLRRKRLSS